MEERDSFRSLCSLALDIQDYIKTTTKENWNTTIGSLFLLPAPYITFSNLSRKYASSLSSHDCPSAAGRWRTPGAGHGVSAGA